MAIEHIFDEIGGFSNFQILMLAWVYSMKFWICWSMIMMSYAGYAPEYACLTSTGLSPSQADQLNESALYSLAKEGINNQSLIDACSVNGTSCEQYHFFESSKTVISEWSLVCDLDWLEATITAVQMSGVLLGSLIGGQCGDYFGRKKTLYGSFLLNAVFSLITYFSFNWEMFMAMSFLIGNTVGIVLVMIVPYPTEFFPLRWRHAIPAFPMWPLGSLAFAGACWLLEDWASLHLAVFILAFPNLLGYFYIPESARWLATKGREEEAYAVLEKMARVNKKELPPSARETIRNIAHSEKQGKEYSFVDLFKGKALLRLTLAASFKWFVLSLVFYGLSFAVSDLAGNLYLNMFLMSVVELPAYFLSFLLIDRIGRRWTCLLFLAISVIVSFGCVGIQLSDLDEHLRNSIISAGCLTAKLAVAAGWSASQTWVTESYPTVMRSLGYGFSNMTSRIGAIVAPFVIDLDNTPLFTFILMGILSVFCMAVTYVIPETRNKVMAETVTSLELQTKITVESRDRENGSSDGSKSGVDPKLLHNSDDHIGSSTKNIPKGEKNGGFVQERF